MGRGANGGRTKSARVSETVQRLLGLEPSGRNSSSFLVNAGAPSFSEALQYSDVVGVEIDLVAAADQFGKTFVRRHHRERVELVGPGVLDHMFRTGMQQQRIALLDRQRLAVAAGDALAMQDVEEFVRRSVLVR